MTQATMVSFLKDIEAQKMGDYLRVTLKDRTTTIDFEITDGIVMINMTDFNHLVSGDDVSLSASDRDDLLEYFEIQAAE